MTIFKAIYLIQALGDYLLWSKFDNCPYKYFLVNFLPELDVSGGSNHPEALQRHISMEHGANPKSMQTFGGGSSQGIYNHELDMSSRYR